MLLSVLNAVAKKRDTTSVAPFQPCRHSEHMATAILGILLGAISLLLDSGNRLFGSYRRTFWGAAIRIALVVLLCTALLSPLVWLAINPSSGASRLFVYVFGSLGGVVFLHFLFPYRWGIKRVRLSESPISTRLLSPYFVLREQVLETPSLPEEAGELVILVLSDLHCNSRSKLAAIQTAFQQLDDFEFDLVFLLGDFGENASILPEVVTALKQLHSRLGIYCVRGNHDFESGRERQLAELAAEHDVVLLSNKTVSIQEIGTELVGLEYPWTDEAAASSTSHAFTIALTHTPDNIRRLGSLNTDFAFAGHTHGGKFRLPFVGSLLLPSRYGRFLDVGWFASGNVLMYVTPGVGYFPGAFGRPAEFFKLTLQQQR